MAACLAVGGEAALASKGPGGTTAGWMRISWHGCAALDADPAVYWWDPAVYWWDKD
jgi:hypothetical protein